MRELPYDKGTSSLVRPAYGPGLLLEDEDLTAAVDYTRDLTRLLFRSLFGCGVICGLAVTGHPDCNGKKLKVVIRRGLALDCAGNPIELGRDVSILWDPDCDRLPSTVYVVACHTDEPCAPREAACGCDDDDAERVIKTRMRDGYRVTLHDTMPEDVCRCGGKSVDDCGCGCECGRCVYLGRLELPIDKSGARLEMEPEAVLEASTEGVRYLSRMLRNPCFGEEKSADDGKDAAISATTTTAKPVS